MDDAQGTMTAQRYDQIHYAVDALEPLAGTKVYLDAGHSGWHSINDIVPRLVAGGVDDATGFFLNISNYRSDSEIAWYGKLAVVLPRLRLRRRRTPPPAPTSTGR